MHNNQRIDGLKYTVNCEFGEYFVELIDHNNKTISGFRIPFQNEEDALELIKLLELTYDDGRRNTLEQIEKQTLQYEKIIPENVTVKEHERTIKIIKSFTVEIKEKIRMS